MSVRNTPRKWRGDTPHHSNFWPVHLEGHLRSFHSTQILPLPVIHDRSTSCKSIHYHSFTIVPLHSNPSTTSHSQSFHSSQIHPLPVIHNRSTPRKSIHYQSFTIVPLNPPTTSHSDPLPLPTSLSPVNNTLQVPPPTYLLPSLLWPGSPNGVMHIEKDCISNSPLHF
ncbi:hypothetical protein AVEN_178501-1 [Araneus ventricosus]|uniref:Uncharacterized protein n=1 Tax=Araneus ventricosus TaxID=182803 RepID=A0A4Y2CDU2_ARAVE|nr:hypothetical protein AVEN_178501-1 [Araneus ventricosus]